MLTDIERLRSIGLCRQVGFRSDISVTVDAAIAKRLEMGDFVHYDDQVWQLINRPVSDGGRKVLHLRHIGAAIDWDWPADVAN